MNLPTNPLEADVIEAAGGLLWRATPGGRELAVIHRPRYDDWTLPKGHREPGESWQQTALREVGEETGIAARLTGFAGSTAYTVDGVAKVVLFWHMEATGDTTFKPNVEVNQLAWLTPAEALERLSYPGERELVSKASSTPA